MTSEIINLHGRKAYKVSWLGVTVKATTIAEATNLITSFLKLKEWSMHPHSYGKKKYAYNVG